VAVFDVVGTLFDLAPVEAVLSDQGAPPGMLEAWFERILHSAGALTLVGEHAPFGEIARATLPTAAARLGAVVDATPVLEALRALPLQPGARDVLATLAESDIRIAALTNSSAEQARLLLEREGVLDRFEEVLSIESVGRYKPDPAPYRFALEHLHVAAGRAAFVAAHAWDAVGASNVGMRAIWVASHEHVWPLPVRAGVEVADLLGAAGAILAAVET
jgi:2-haloacid dehalogenase